MYKENCSIIFLSDLFIFREIWPQSCVIPVVKLLNYNLFKYKRVLNHWVQLSVLF